MAAFASTDVTITVTETQIVGRKRHTRGTMTFGDGALTYPTAGIPLGASANARAKRFGMERQLDSVQFFGVNERTSDYMVKYGPANGTVLLYEEEGTAAGGPLLECDTSEAPAARTYSWVAVGW